MTRVTTRPEPADGLIHPIVVLSIAALVVNDHVLKTTWGHVVTGKASDFAGLVFFPLLLVAMLEIVRWARGTFTAPSRGALIAAILITGATFALVEVTPAASLYEVGLGSLQQPRLATHALIAGDLDRLPRVTATSDVTDLVALPILYVSYLVGRKRVR